MFIGQFSHDDVRQRHTSDEEIADDLLEAACEPLLKRRREEIGPERLSLERLGRYVDFTVGHDSATVYAKFGFRFADLALVVQALDPPSCFRT